MIDALVEATHTGNVIMDKGGAPVGGHIEIGGALPAGGLFDGQGVGLFLPKADAAETEQQLPG